MYKFPWCQVIQTQQKGEVRALQISHKKKNPLYDPLINNKPGIWIFVLTWNKLYRLWGDAGSGLVNSGHLNQMCLSTTQRAQNAGVTGRGAVLTGGTQGDILLCTLSWIPWYHNTRRRDAGHHQLSDLGAGRTYGDTQCECFALSKHILYDKESLYFHLTCDLTDVKVISGDILRTPGISLNTVNGSRLQVFKRYQSLCGVEAVLAVWTILDDAEAVKDSMSNWLPLYHNTGVTGRTGVELWSREDCRHAKEGTEKGRNVVKDIYRLKCLLILWPRILGWASAKLRMISGFGEWMDESLLSVLFRGITVKK